MQFFQYFNCKAKNLTLLRVTFLTDKVQPFSGEKKTSVFSMIT